jgi:hypothetical protein
MENHKTETLEERIEKAGELFKRQMRDKAKRMLELNSTDELDIDLIEAFWKGSRQDADKILLDFYNDTANVEIQKEQVRKKKLNYPARDIQ